jgi:hypothetical protein
VIATTTAVTAQSPRRSRCSSWKPATGNQITVQTSAPQNDLRAFVDTMAATDAKPLTKDARRASGRARWARSRRTSTQFHCRGHGRASDRLRESLARHPRPGIRARCRTARSSSTGMTRDRSAYSAAYCPHFAGLRAGATTYPVLYLLHGSGGVEGS